MFHEATDFLALLPEVFCKPQEGGDSAGQCHGSPVFQGANCPSLGAACAALILALKGKRLQLTVAPSRRGESLARETAAAAGKVRKLSPAMRAQLDKALLALLAELGHADELKPLPMSLSKAKSKVWLARVETDAQLVVQAIEGGHQAAFALADLSAADHDARPPPESIQNAPATPPPPPNTMGKPVPDSGKSSIACSNEPLVLVMLVKTGSFFSPIRSRGSHFRRRPRFRNEP